MAFAGSFSSPTSLFGLPNELVAEIASYAGLDDHDNHILRRILCGRSPHSKDASNFALVSKRLGAAKLKAFHSVVYGAKSWGEDTQQTSDPTADSPMAKLNLRPFNPYQCSLLGSTYPTGYIRTVVLARPCDSGEDSFFRVSPSKLREVLLALPNLINVVFAQTVALNDPVRRAAGGPALKVPNVIIQQRGGNESQLIEEHLPRLLSLFDEIDELEYSSDHQQPAFEAISDPLQPLVKVTKLGLWSINSGRPSGALKAMASLLDCPALRNIRFTIDSWTVYESCAVPFNDILKRSSNVEKLALEFPDSTGGHWSCCQCRLSSRYCLRHGQNPPQHRGEIPDLGANIDLSALTNLRSLYVSVDPYGYEDTWSQILALYRGVAHSKIETIHTLLYYENDNDDITLAERLAERPDSGEQSLGNHAEAIRTILCDGCEKLRSFTVALWTHQSIYDELRDTFDACVGDSRARDLIVWDVAIMDEDDAYLEAEAEEAAEYWERRAKATNEACVAEPLEDEETSDDEDHMESDEESSPSSSSSSDSGDSEIDTPMEEAHEDTSSMTIDQLFEMWVTSI